MSAPAFGGIGRALGVQAQEHGVAIREELLDRLLRPQRDVLSLVIFDDQIEPRGPVIEPELQLGLGKRARHGLARFDLRDLLSQILGGVCVGSRQPEAGHPATRCLTVEHSQQRGLAHVAMTKQRDPFRPGQPQLQSVESICAAVGLPHAFLLPGRNGPVDPVVRAPSVLVLGQWSVVSGQWSVVSGQWSVVSGNTTKTRACLPLTSHYSLATSHYPSHYPWSVSGGRCGKPRVPRHSLEDRSERPEDQPERPEHPADRQSDDDQE